MHKGDEKCVQILIGRPEGTRLLGRPSHRWEDNTEMDLKEVCGRVWTSLVYRAILIITALLLLI
jgi:hypothetical protein